MDSNEIVQRGILHKNLSKKNFELEKTVRGSVASNELI